jgi:integrase
MAVPIPCRPRLGGLSEFKASLRTGVLREAKLLAGKLAANAHLVYLHAQKDSSQLEKQDKQAIRALAKTWLLNGLDCCEAERLSCNSSIRAEVRTAHINSFENMSECDQKRPLPSEFLSDSVKMNVESLKTGNDSLGIDELSYRLTGGAANEFSSLALCGYCEDLSEAIFSDAIGGFEEKACNAQYSDGLDAESVGGVVSEIVGMMIEMFGGGMLDHRKIRAQLSQLLARLLEESNKQPISQKEIRERLNGYLRALLEKDDMDIHPRKGVSGPGIELTAAQLLASNASLMSRFVDNPDSLVKSVIECIPVLISEGVFKPEEISNENVLQIVKAHLKIQVLNSRIKAARANGDYLMEQTVFAAPYKQYPPIIEEVVVEKGQSDSVGGELLSEFIEKYIQTKLSDGAWKDHGVADHRGRLVNLVEILGDKAVFDVSRDDMRYFRDVLRKLPPNRTKLKEYKGKAISDILEMTPARVLSVKTVNVIVETASSMFDWGVREGHLSQNPAKGLSIKDDRQEIGLRDAFSPEDIQKIFASDHYAKGDFKHPSFFWAPLIAVYTGMRLEEVCQLSLEDIYESEQGGAWIIDVNANQYLDGKERKLLKNKNAARIIPIHQDLIQVGLLDYHASLNKKGVERLFPELNKTASSPKFGKQPGKSFGKLVKTLDLGGNKTFHSLRHSFSDFFKVKGLHNDTFRQIFGHEIPELAGRQYGSKFDVRTCYDEVVSRLNYGIDISLVNAKPYL